MKTQPIATSLNPIYVNKTEKAIRANPTCNKFDTKNSHFREKTRQMKPKSGFQPKLGHDFPPTQTADCPNKELKPKSGFTHTVT